MVNKKVRTKAKQILVGVWTGDTAPTTGDELTSVIADTLNITQDDPETNDIDCETSDSPIYTTTVAGKYTMTLNNASMDADYLKNVMGFVEKSGDLLAPSTYAERHIALQVKFADDDYVYLPKVLVSPKVVFENLKSNIAYGTLSGTCELGDVKGEQTPFAMLKSPILTVAQGA